MTYVYKVVRVEVDNVEDYNNFIRSLSSSFRDRYIYSWMYAIIKLGIPKKANVVTPEFQTNDCDYIKCRCDSAKFIKVEKIFFKAIAKLTFLLIEEMIYIIMI